jgi:molybdenum cofactor cytidylyltransferase
MSGPIEGVSAVVLAAGLSTRMGKPKMLLPWGDTTVLEKVVGTLLEAGVHQPVVVTGSGYDQLCVILGKYPVRLVFNPRYTDGEMLHSLQTGIASLGSAIQAVFIVLGDQPQLQSGTVKSLLNEYESVHASLIIPSYQMHRGHPWLIGKNLWQELLELKLPETLRDFLRRHAADIHYLNIDNPTILEDLDTPDEYQKFRPS